MNLFTAARIYATLAIVVAAHCIGCAPLKCVCECHGKMATPAQMGGVAMAAGQVPIAAAGPIPSGGGAPARFGDAVPVKWCGYKEEKGMHIAVPCSDGASSMGDGATLTTGKTPPRAKKAK